MLCEFNASSKAKRCGMQKLPSPNDVTSVKPRDKNKTKQQQQNKHKQTSNGVVRPNESTKISTNHLLAPLQEMFIDITLFSSVKAAHRSDCTLCKCCAKGRRVLLEMGSFESTVLIPADVGIARQVRCDSPATNIMLD